jgi:hypothetical protein
VHVYKVVLQQPSGAGEGIGMARVVDTVDAYV